MRRSEFSGVKLAHPGMVVEATLHTRTQGVFKDLKPPEDPEGYSQ